MNFRFFKNISSEWKYILFLFALSRILLTGIGVFSRTVMAPFMWGILTFPFFQMPVWLDIWGVYDSWWYLEIAQYGYSDTVRSVLVQNICCGQNTYGFFPLYPILIHILGGILSNYFIAGIIISNVSLLFSA